MCDPRYRTVMREITDCWSDKSHLRWHLLILKWCAVNAVAVGKAEYSTKRSMYLFNNCCIPSHCMPLHCIKNEWHLIHSHVHSGSVKMATCCAKHGQFLRNQIKFAQWVPLLVSSWPISYQQEAVFGYSYKHWQPLSKYRRIRRDFLQHTHSVDGRNFSFFSLQVEQKNRSMYGQL